MPPALRFLWRSLAVAVLVLAAGPGYAAQADSITIIEGLGKGTVQLNGPCQFRTGDNPAWASPSFDSAGWERLATFKPWGVQGHARYTGIAWYRCALQVTPAPGLEPRFSLLMPEVDDAYEVYWNGALVGRYGKFPPNPVWYSSPTAQTFELGRIERGVLAVRVWKAPLFSDDSSAVGGFEAAPLLGSPEAIATARVALDYDWLRSSQIVFAENLLYALIGLLSFLLWYKSHLRRPLFWMTWFSLVPPVNFLLLRAHIPWQYSFAMGLAQSIGALRDISLWFLLLWLLPIHENRALVRRTRILASICIIDTAVDGILIATSWRPEWIGAIQVADGISAAIYTLLTIYPVYLAGYALTMRKRLDAVSLRVAGLAFAAEFFEMLRNGVKQGRQYTNWPISDHFEDPLFTLWGSDISLYTLSGVFLLVAIVYAIYNSVREDQRRQLALEREKIELVHAQEQMRFNAEHDGLTGLLNRRVIVQRLRKEIDRAQRDETGLSVILVDVDHFKRINDCYGHLAGDVVLREISAIFSNSLRSYDWVGRYGGEEFLLILPGTDIDDALYRAEQLRRAVELAEIVDGETTLRVTASFGVAADFALGCTAEEIIRTVDTALYRAKSVGRNCVMTPEIDLPVYES